MGQDAVEGPQEEEVVQRTENRKYLVPRELCEEGHAKQYGAVSRTVWRLRQGLRLPHRGTRG